ncbi:hypothetical protein [Desulfofustis limnaeus]|uniref:Uncharacterized protein n=1 Tax=Desulfofustis limnaeus TaxID=2740163 RepID=A0ABM7W4S6_9BACT|nr:hypothetical protein [Desulfofustis limnaeus]BDD85918.1 hypothetical protein DPPLL_02830 [Desulfofustis limnaeus]
MATNLWAKFKRLLPDSPLIIVTVESVDSATGTSMVTTAGGGAMRVFGTGVAAGSKAYVRDNTIIEAAPNLTHYEIEV